MIKRLIYIFTILLLAACSDDEKYTVEPMGDDDTITFSISIPEPEKVVSRAEKEDGPDERKINDLSVLIYNADGTQLLQSKLNVTDFTTPAGDNSNTKITVTLNDDAKAHRNNVTVYIIANAGALLDATNTASVTALRGVTTDATLPATDGFIMSGIVKSKLTSASLLTNPVTLYRTAAKFTIASAVGASGSSPATEASNFDLESAALYNGATAGYVIAGTEKGLYAQSTEGSAQSNDNLLLYTYPCESSKNANTCLVIGGKYKGDLTYYRIDLAKKEADGNYTSLDINPNHWYEIVIEKVTGRGYSSAVEAMKHPATNIEVRITDHAPRVLNMAFDGTHELGVTDNIVFSGEPGGSTDFAVKLYSTNSADLNTNPVFTPAANWFTIEKEPTAKKDDNGGNVYTYTVKFTDDTRLLGLGDLESTITVTWQGLTRQINVKWVREFKPGDIFTSTKLIIYPENKSDKKIEIADYWTFLAGNGEETTEGGTAPTLFGVQPADMGGKVRNQGFHFPVNYGNSGALWTYNYEVETNIDINTDNYDVTATVDTNFDKYVTCSTSTKNNKFTFTLTGKAVDDYTYKVGTLKITIKQKAGDQGPTDYKFDLYHTGFFHYDTGKHRIDAHDTGYYYYEVLPVDGTAGSTATTRYILDRNLGAKAAGMYIQTADGNSYVDSSKWPFSPGEKSAGGYYDVADKGDYTNPIPHGDLCPPGYRVPQQRMWDAIRNSRNFTTAQYSDESSSYFQAQYTTTVDVTRNRETIKEIIYFPKARYMENEALTGESNAGYYWSITASAGTEKDEIGRWLKSLQITGEVTSYINGNVDTFGMSVRPINDQTDTENYNVISFNVKGATHVFLYSGDTKSRNYTTSWPGHAIGNSDTADKQFFNFVYETTVYEAKDLKVIFNYVKDGKITTISQNGIDGLHDGDTWAQGWDVSALLNKNVTVDHDKKTMTYPK